MSRRTCFAPRHEPFVAQDGLELKDGHTHGPFPFLNPTRAHFRKTAPEKDKATATATSDEEDGPKTEQVADNVGFKWRSRDNRKGRHALMVEPATDPAKAKYVTPLPSNSPQEILKGIRRMFTKFPVWDVSYLVATIFTLGSVRDLAEVSRLKGTANVKRRWCGASTPFSSGSRSSDHPPCSTRRSPAEAASRRSLARPSSNSAAGC